MATNTEKQEGFLKQAGAVVTATYNAIMKGGELQAAVRQGFNEIGEALKAFPDSVQVDEPGQVFNPLYSDIAADKRAHREGMEAKAATLPTPGELASGKSSGTVRGDTQAQANGKPTLSSPGDIARDQSQPQDHGQERGQEHGRGM